MFLAYSVKARAVLPLGVDQYCIGCSWFDWSHHWHHRL